MHLMCEKPVFKSGTANVTAKKKKQKKKEDGRKAAEGALLCG